VPSELPTKIEPGDDGEYAGKGFQDYVNANYPKYEETDMNRLAVNDEDLPHASLTTRNADRDLAVGTAQIDGIYTGVAQIPTDLDGGSTGPAGQTTQGGYWDEPTTPYDATYPNNHVYESEGGHLREMDDTEGAERIHERHASGTGYEIGPEGTKVTRVKKDNYTIISDDDYAHIQGTSRTTIDEGLRIRVNALGESGNNYNIEIGAGSNVNVEVNGGSINLTTLSPDVGDININASRDLNMQVNRNVKIGVLGKVDIDVKGDWTESTKNKTESTETHIMNAKLQDINADSEIDADAPTINLN
jgi:hypothetical protein